MDWKMQCYGYLLIVAVILVTCVAGHEKGKSQNKLCENVDCGKARVCDVVDDSVTCVCIKSCPDHERKVCGSDKKTYRNHCELHRQACVSGVALRIKYEGECIPDESDKLKRLEEKLQKKPIVCFSHERDALRQSIIAWIQSQASLPGRKAYREVMKHVFKTCDGDKDKKLDSAELLQCIAKTNSTQLVQNGSPTEILRGLCVDALIDLADADTDWKLTFREFKKMMDLDYVPPRKRCSLELNEYEDGAETTVDCNKCVCACGNWVCTAMACKKDEETSDNLVPVVEVKAVNPKLLQTDEDVEVFLKDFKSAGDKMHVKTTYDHVDDERRRRAKRVKRRKNRKQKL